MEVETQIAFVTIMMLTGNEEQPSPEQKKYLVIISKKRTKINKYFY